MKAKRLINNISSCQKKNILNQINKFSYDSYKHENNAKEIWSQPMLKFDPIKLTFSARQQLSIFYVFSRLLILYVNFG